MSRNGKGAHFLLSFHSLIKFQLLLYLTFHMVPPSVSELPRLLFHSICPRHPGLTLVLSS